MSESKSERFIKFIPSEEAMWLLKNRGHAFRLLTIIAESARRYDGDPDGLKIGEAYIGGFENYDMTERNYRTAKEILVKRRHLEIVETCRTRQKSTTGTTTVGTKVRLLSSNVWDINLESYDDLSDDCPTTDRRPTDDKQRIVKNVKKDKEQQQQPQTPSSFAAAVFHPFPYKILQEDKRLSDEDRSALMQFPEERVRLAIEFSHNQQPKTTLIRLLVWHCTQQIPPTAGKANENIKRVNGTSHEPNGTPRFIPKKRTVFPPVEIREVNESNA